MSRLLRCRRTVVCIAGIIACAGINLNSDIDTSGAIALICAALAGANAAQGSLEARSPKQIMAQGE